MRTLLLAPHSDDETLFAAYVVLRYQPDVIVCAGDPNPRMRERREQETRVALAELGHPLERLFFLPFVEGQLRPAELKAELVRWADTVGYDQTFAPAVETNGHAEHNLVGAAALDTFGPKNVVSYLTYSRTGGRSRDGRELPYLPQWVGAKLKALSAYKTQHAIPGRQEWFTSMIDLREWVV